MKLTRRTWRDGRRAAAEILQPCSVVFSLMRLVLQYEPQWFIKYLVIELYNRLRITAHVMKYTASPIGRALCFLGRDAQNVTQTAATLGICPGAMLAAAWQVLEQQSADAQPWHEVAAGWCDEASATRQDVIFAAVRIDAAQRCKKKVAA